MNQDTVLHGLQQQCCRVTEGCSSVSNLSWWRCFFFFGAISSFLGHLIKNKRIPVLWYGFKWFISFYVLIVNLLTRHYAEGDQKQWTQFQIHSPPHQRKLQRISPAEYNSRYALQRNLSSFASTTMKYFII